MTSVERVKTICKERKVPISRLERECRFANGYISQLKTDFRERKTHDFKPNTAIMVNIMVNKDIKKEASP